MFTACPTTSAKGEDRRPAVIMTEWSIGSTDLTHFISTINGDLKALTTYTLMIGNQCDWLALNNILWSSICGPAITPTIRSTIDNRRPKEMKNCRSSEASITPHC